MTIERREGKKLKKHQTISLDLTAEYVIKLQAIPRVQCVMPCTVPASSRGRNRPKGQECACTAKVYVNYKPYCLRHAQQVALNILIRNKLADMIDNQEDARNV